MGEAPEMAETEPSRLRPLVSVVVSTYNHGQYLAQAIESIVRQQTTFDFEVLIGDDCSTDNTREIAEEYQRRYPDCIRVFASDRNLGAHANDARLTAASGGKYLAYCEGDDYWNTSDKLARQVAFLEANPDHGAVHSDCAWVARVRGEWRSIPTRWGRHRLVVPRGDIFYPILRDNLLRTCTLVVRKDLMLEYLCSGLPVEDFWLADWAFAIYLGHETLIGYIDEPLATYRKVPGSMTNQDASTVLAMARANIEMVTVLCDHFEVEAAVRMHAYRGLVWRLLRSALQAGDFATARSAYNWLDAHPPFPKPWSRRLIVGTAVRHPALAALFRAADAGAAVLARRRVLSAPPPGLES